MNYQQTKAMNSNQSSLSWSDHIARVMERLAVIATKLKRRVTWELKRLASVPAQVAGRFSNLPFIEKNILYPRYVKALRENESALPTLNSMDSRIVDELVRTGIRVTSLESLGIPNTAKMFEAAKKIKESLKENSLLPTNKNNSTIYATADELMKYPEIFHWGLEERLLKIAERYLGVPVAYDGILFTMSIADGTEYGVRAWHRDVEDRRMVRLCIYLNDVDEDGGPFQYMRSETSSLLYDLENDEKTAVYDKQYNKQLKQLSRPSRSDCMTCTGSAGTVIFADTARNYHRGKPPTQSNRFAIFFTYLSRRPLHPYFCHRSVLSGKYLHRLIEGLSPAQRACVLWNKNLPSLVKWIPKKLT
jgi:hypothetical protein